MARKKVECITCDRCDKTYEEVEAGEEAPDRCKLVLESFAGDLSFEDLCERCTKRVTDLVGQLKMDSKDTKETKNPKKPAEKKAASKKEEKKEEPKKEERHTRPAETTSDFA